MLNKIFIAGRLCDNPELKSTGTGVPVVNFRIACDRDQKNRNGERETDFFSCVAFRATAEFIARYFEKGRAILIEGSMRANRWTGQDGQTRESWDVLIERAYFADSKPAAAPAPAPMPAGYDEISNQEGLPF